MRLADVTRRPVRLRLTGNEAHERRSVAGMFETVRADRVLPAGRACDSDAVRVMLAERRTGLIFPPVQPGQDIPVSRPCRLRKAVECLFSRIRRISSAAARHDKRDDNILASIQTASVRIWLKGHEPVNRGRGR